VAKDQVANLAAVSLLDTPNRLQLRLPSARPFPVFAAHRCCSFPDRRGYAPL